MTRSQGEIGMGVITVWNATRGTLVGRGVVVANTSLSRAIGLLGRTALEAGCGLWITPSSGVHTIGMRFRIDVVGLDAELRVVRLWSDLAAYRLTAINFKVRSVLELAAGQIAGTGIRIGDYLQMDGRTFANCASVPVEPSMAGQGLSDGSQVPNDQLLTPLATSCNLTLLAGG